MIAPSIGFGLFFNAAALSGKLHDLHDYIYNRPLLFIIGIVETWLHKDIPDDSLNASDHNVFRFDRATRGGWVMLLIPRADPEGGGGKGPWPPPQTVGLLSYIMCLK